MLVDNKSAEKSDWNHGKLSTNFTKLKTARYDLKKTGFDNVELKRLNINLNSLKLDEKNPPLKNKPTPPPPTPPVNNGSPESPEVPEDEWEGMPEFKQEDKNGIVLIVHFPTREDVNKFAGLVEQTITEKTKYIWYPKQERQSMKDHVYVPEE